MNDQVLHIGIIVENDTDFQCLKILIKKIEPAKQFSLKRRVAGGGGNMFNILKMEQWTKSLHADNCHFLLIVHDLDRDGVTKELNDKNKLMDKLKNALEKNPINKICIVVPIEELEA
ncbi:hypothetical protein FACS1894164_14210 [Spirochaetia bacterium]|nr:hypothetical protein FACS1894164_14210 [Spirochaetia bacterium]